MEEEREEEREPTANEAFVGGLYMGIIICVILGVVLFCLNDYATDRNWKQKINKVGYGEYYTTADGKVDWRFKQPTTDVRHQ